MPSITTATPISAAPSGDDDVGNSVQTYFLGMELYMLILTISAIVILVLALVWLCWRKGWCKCSSSDASNSRVTRGRPTDHPRIRTSVPELYVPPGSKKEPLPDNAPHNAPTSKAKPRPEKQRQQQQQQKQQKKKKIQQPKKEPTIKVGSSWKKPSVHVGSKVVVDGYGCSGTVRFIGDHHQTGEPRIGVELLEPIGKNNGTVGGCMYFSCPPNHGILTLPKKVKPATRSQNKQILRMESVGLNPGYRADSVDEGNLDEDFAVNPAYNERQISGC